MALVSINRLWTSRGGTDTFTRQRVYREQWEAITDSATDDEEVVAGAGAAALGLPRLGQPHPRYPFAVCTEIEAEQTEESPFRWMVSLKYDSNPQLPNGTDPDGASQDPADIPDNPLLRPATWELSFETTTEPATRWIPMNTAGDLIGAPAGGGITGAVRRLLNPGGFVPIRNSALLPFDPALQVEVSRPVYRITKNVAFLPTTFAMSLENALNDRLWRGVPRYCAKIRGCRAANKFENGVAYVELSIEIALKSETWIPSILDAGFYTYSPGSQSGTPPPKWTPIVDPQEGPYLLDGDGQRLAANADPVFLRGLPANYQLQNFAALLNF